MKKIIFFILFFASLTPTYVANAQSTEPGPSTPLLRPSFKINENNTVTIYWNKISDVKNYRICVNSECAGEDSTKKWYQYDPNVFEASFDIATNETKTFWVHAELWPSATEYNELDLRNCCAGVKWANPISWLRVNNTPEIVTTTTTVPVTAASVPVTVKPKKKQQESTPTTIDYSQELKDAGLLYGFPANTTTTTTTTTPNKVTIEKKEMTMFGLRENEFFVIAILFVLGFIYITAMQINRWKMAKMKFELEIKEKEFSFEARTYELKELAKAKLNNEHEESMKKIDYNNANDKLEFTERQLNNERNYNLEQQKINSTNADKVLDYIMPIVQRRDDHELKMAELKSERGLGSVIDADDVKSGTVKFNIKK